jgi:hypothetical protein
MRVSASPQGYGETSPKRVARRRRIVFDRVTENSDIVLIDLPDLAASSSR